MSNKIVAYCGLVCSECPAHVATQADDCAALEQVAGQWREQFNAPEITADSIICDGCLGSDGGRLASYCAMCEIRACGVARGVPNCAHCADYACEKLGVFLSQSLHTRTMLEQIRAAL